MLAEIHRQPWYFLEHVPATNLHYTFHLPHVTNFTIVLGQIPLYDISWHLQRLLNLVVHTKKTSYQNCNCTIRKTGFHIYCRQIHDSTFSKAFKYPAGQNKYTKHNADRNVVTIKKHVSRLLANDTLLFCLLKRLLTRTYTIKPYIGL